MESALRELGTAGADDSAGAVNTVTAPRARETETCVCSVPSRTVGPKSNHETGLALGKSLSR